MSEEQRFDVVFAKLVEAIGDAGDGNAERRTGDVVVTTAEFDVAELDEINELRKIVLELTEPEPKCYSTT